MILFGKIESKKYYCLEYNFRLEIDTTSDNNDWLLNDKLTRKQQRIIDGGYDLKIHHWGNDKVFYESSFYSDKRHPIEILQLISNHKNWDVTINEILCTSVIEVENLLTELTESIAYYIDEENLDLYDDVYEGILATGDGLLHDIIEDFNDNLNNFENENFTESFANIVTWVTDNSCYNPKLEKFADKIIKRYNLVEKFS